MNNKYNSTWPIRFVLFILLNLSMEPFTHHNIAKIIQSKHHFAYNNINNDNTKTMIRETINELFPQKICTSNMVKCVMNELLYLSYYSDSK